MRGHVPSPRSGAVLLRAVWLVLLSLLCAGCAVIKPWPPNEAKDDLTEEYVVSTTRVRYDKDPRFPLTRWILSPRVRASRYPSLFSDKDEGNGFTFENKRSSSLTYYYFYVSMDTNTRDVNFVRFCFNYPKVGRQDAKDAKGALPGKVKVMEIRGQVLVQAGWEPHGASETMQFFFPYDLLVELSNEDATLSARGEGIHKSITIPAEFMRGFLHVIGPAQGGERDWMLPKRRLPTGN